jgi:hypothetical protein
MKTTAANELTSYFICLRTDLSMAGSILSAGTGRCAGDPFNVLVRSRANKGQGSPRRSPALPLAHG